MKTIEATLLLLSITLLSSCSSDDNDTKSAIFFVGSTQKTILEDPYINGGTILVFTGDDIDWFNVTTGEIHFNKSFSKFDKLANITYLAIRLNDSQVLLYLGFTTAFYSQIINEPVFYYDINSRKYFIKDGYPDLSAGLLDKDEIKKERTENWQKIEKNWKVFLSQLKKEGRYKK